MNVTDALMPSIVLMGPSGCGKTTIGTQLATLLQLNFVDADDHHSASNVEKMRAGFGLTDDDRAPWLETLRALIAKERPLVVACSALKKSYRAILKQGSEPMVFVYLKVSPEELERRLSLRTGHFAGSLLLQSQLAALEEPEPSETSVLLISGEGNPAHVVSLIHAGLGF